MTREYPHIAFGLSTKEVQLEEGSRALGQRLEMMEWNNRTLGERERDLIEGLDHFYMASLTESGWPYLQFRGGPRGFLRFLEPSLIGFCRLPR